MSPTLAGCNVFHPTGVYMTSVLEVSSPHPRSRLGSRALLLALYRSRLP